MNLKKVITIVLLAFVAVSLIMVVIKGLPFDSPKETAENSMPAQQDNQDVSLQTADISDSILTPDANVDMVYYFMTKQRCPSCIKIDSYTKEAVQKHFGEKLADKTMMWQMVEVDEPQNSHFIQDYELFTKSVVLVRYRNGKQVKWKNLNQVWNLLGNKEKFQDYIVQEVNVFIGES